MQPPPTPSERRLARVLAVARVDGWSVILLASVTAAWTLGERSWELGLTAALVLLAGAVELRGRGRLLRRDPRGIGWLVGAQLGLIGIIWAYAWWRWRFFDPADFWTQLPGFFRTELDRQMIEAGLEPGLDRPLVLEMMNTLACLLLAVLTLLYQGGLAVYYATRRRAVTEALLASPPPVS